MLKCLNTPTSIASTGALQTTAALDYETVTSYNLVIQASDGTHSATANYVISVTPVNEYDPVFSPASDTKSINENVALGTTLATVSSCLTSLHFDCLKEYFKDYHLTS